MNAFHGFLKSITSFNPFEFSPDWWDRAVIWSSGLVAMAALAIGISTVGSIKANKRAARVSADALERYKSDTAVELAKANEKAATATKAAAELGVKVDQLPSYVAEKEKQLNDLATSMKQNQVALDRARESAQISQTKAETALATLRKESQGRTLSNSEREIIIKSLKGQKFPTVFVQSDSGDIEAFPYAMEIMSALQHADIKTEYQPWPSTFMWINEPGIFVVTSGAVPKEQSEALKNALNAAGLGAKLASTSEDMAPKPPLPGRLSILIWKKALPKVP